MSFPEATEPEHRSDDDDDDGGDDLGAIDDDREAYAFVSSMLQTQSIASETTKTGSVRGDTKFRRLFLTLLRSADQRRMFMEFVSKASTVHRTASLFGQPPYAFLLPSDGTSLSAAMIGPSRRNMAKAVRQQHQADAAGQIPSTANFGGAHFVDKEERHYRVFSTAADQEQGATGFFVRRATRKQNLQLVIRVRKQQSGKQQTMPSVGQEIVLSVGKSVKRIGAMRTSETLVGTINGLVMRAPRSATALVRLRVDTVSDALY